MSFTEFGLHPSLLRGVEDLGFAQPTPIQRDSIPPAMEGRDVLACAMTGSGKTAAFMLPIFHRLGARKRGGPRVLILSPTRELAAQIHEHGGELAKYTNLTGAAVFGGVGMQPQERAFRNGVDVMVATPGRLLDHLSYPYASFANLEILVLDEADRMLDMGFLPDIRRVLSHLPRERQTLLFSATLPQPIVALAHEMLRDPVTLNIERQSAPATGITHAAYSVPQTLKSPLLLHLLQTEAMKSVVVFTRTKHRADRVADYLGKHGISSARIHGNRSQAQRTDALAGFKQGQYRVLVATDIAARGIDVEALSHVVNFDTPAMSEDYIHRAGRTARAEATGDAVTFVSPEEEGDFRAIERAIGKRIPRVEPVDFHPANVEPVRPERPLAERIAEIRARKAEERARAAAKAARKAANVAAEEARRQGQEQGRPAGPRPGQGRGGATQPAPASNGGNFSGGGRQGGNRSNAPAPRGNGNAGRPALPTFRSVRGNQ